MKRKANYAGGQLAELDGDDFTGRTTSDLMALHGHGIPQDTDELQARINDYFLYCQTRSIRPGIETLCLALGTTRPTLWKWRKYGKGSNPALWSEIVGQAWQFIVSFLEVAGTSGKLTPPVAIFLMKNWSGYKDNEREHDSMNHEEKGYINAPAYPVLGEKPLEVIGTAKEISPEKPKGKYPRLGKKKPV